MACPTKLGLALLIVIIANRIHKGVETNEVGGNRVALSIEPAHESVDGATDHGHGRVGSARTLCP